MSEPKWTPGPWWINPDHRPGMSWNREIVYGDGSNRICFMAHSDDPERDKANADLIAAAQELYLAAALQEKAEDAHANCAECEGEGVPELCPVCFPLFDDARIRRRSALSKAHGEPE